MKNIRRIFRLLIISGQIFLIYWRFRAYIRPFWPYAQMILKARPDVLTAMRELRQINTNIKH